jgi:putative DNA primase/helicase
MTDTAADQHTDLSNARSFAESNQGFVLYCAATGKWLIWNGSFWEWDEVEAVMCLAQNHVNAMLDEALAIADGYKRRACVQHALRSQNRARIESMLRLARAHLPVRLEELDCNPLLLNVANGTLDLSAMTLRPHRQADFITRQAPVEYELTAKCPQWTKFLREITNDSQPVIDYLQRCVGYTLTGETAEHCLFILFGTGLNGKSTFVEALRCVFGDYARTADFSAFASGRPTSGARNDLARLATARLVTAAESDNSCELAEAVVKQVTGGDKIAARFLYAESFEFTPAFKLWLCTNHRPKIRGVDDGIWRRIRLIPFAVRIPDEKIDRHLLAKLGVEASGILTWAVEGLKQYRVQGLNEPSAIKAATSDYRLDEDVLEVVS